MIIVREISIVESTIRKLEDEMKRSIHLYVPLIIMSTQAFFLLSITLNINYNFFPSYLYFAFVVSLVFIFGISSSKVERFIIKILTKRINKTISKEKQRLRKIMKSFGVKT